MRFNFYCCDTGCSTRPNRGQSPKETCFDEAISEACETVSKTKKGVNAFKLRLEAAGLEPRVVVTKVKLEKKALRARNRNRRAASGHKRAMTISELRKMA